MPALRVIEDNICEIALGAAEALSLLTTPGESKSPTHYLAVIQAITRLRDVFARHRRLERCLFPLLVANDSDFAHQLAAIERTQAEAQSRLETLCSAGWPRSTQVGMHCLSIRGVEALNLLLGTLEQENTVIVPLLRRWVPAEVTPDGSFLQNSLVVGAVYDPARVEVRDRAQS